MYKAKGASKLLNSTPDLIKLRMKKKKSVVAICHGFLEDDFFKCETAENV